MTMIFDSTLTGGTFFPGFPGPSWNGNIVTENLLDTNFSIVYNQMQPVGPKFFTFLFDLVTDKYIWTHRFPIERELMSWDQLPFLYPEVWDA